MTTITAGPYTSKSHKGLVRFCYELYQFVILPAFGALLPDKFPGGAAKSDVVDSRRAESPQTLQTTNGSGKIINFPTGHFNKNLNFE